MPAPDSYDLRQKAIDALERGERKSEVCRLLNISRNPLELWLKRMDETGDGQAISGFPTGNRHKITDGDRFERFVPAHGDKTQSRMAQLWGDITVIKNEMKSNAQLCNRV